MVTTQGVLLLLLLRPPRPARSPWIHSHWGEPSPKGCSVEMNCKCTGPTSTAHQKGGEPPYPEVGCG